MKEIKEIIGDNLTELRKKKGLTQIELAEKFNYSDTAVSKWEKGLTLPPIDVLVQLAGFYGVTLDYLVKEGDSHEKKMMKSEDIVRRKHLIITLLASVVVWITATIAFSIASITMRSLGALPTNLWMIFCWAVPVNAIVLIVFNAIWGKRHYMAFVVSTLVWSLLACIYLQVCLVTSAWSTLWIVFTIGIPLTIGAVLLFKVKKYEI